MKKMLIVGMLLIGGWTHASIILSQTFTENASITPGGVGQNFTGAFNLANPSDTVLNITVGLSVSGGYSGQFYCYLIAPDGSTRVTLLDNPGTSTTGVNVTFQDGATAITSTSDLSSGTWAPQNKNGSQLSNFNGQSANGDWTIFFADLNTSDSGVTLNSWTLNITVVPEPVVMGLVLFTGLVLLWWVLGICWKKPANGAPLEADDYHNDSSRD